MGRVWKFESDINTDLITPGRYNLTTDKKELAKICFIEFRPEFAEKVREGDFIVAEENFGSGSSRETAAVAIKASGIKCIIAKSFSRIFFRNSINIGLPVLVCKEAADEIKETDDIEINMGKGIISNKTSGKKFRAEAFPDFLLEIINAGGVVNYLNKGEFK